MAILVPAVMSVKISCKVSLWQEELSIVSGHEASLAASPTGQADRG